jgi:hypothetical protein
MKQCGLKASVDVSAYAVAMKLSQNSVLWITAACLWNGVKSRAVDIIYVNRRNKILEVVNKYRKRIAIDVKDTLLSPSPIVYG